MKAKFPKLCSTLKERKFFLQVSTKLPEFGMFKVESSSKCLKVMKMKFFLACLTMKETLLSQDQKIIPAKFGGMRKSSQKIDFVNIV
jgi:hypothetical protein